MSAVKDVQRSLNVIRRLSTEENAAVQTQILELILQASISQLKSISTDTNNKTPAPVKPAPLPIPKPPRASVSSADTKVPATQQDLRSIKPQAPIS